MEKAFFIIMKEQIEIIMEDLKNKINIIKNILLI
jgi:hypothetical protein